MRPEAPAGDRQVILRPSPPERSGRRACQSRGVHLGMPYVIAINRFKPFHKKEDIIEVLFGKELEGASAHPDGYTRAFNGLLRNHPSLPLQQDVNAPVAVTHPSLTNLFDLRFERGLREPTRFVAIAGGIKLQNPAGPALRHRPIAHHLASQLALARRP